MQQIYRPYKKRKKYLSIISRLDRRNIKPSLSLSLSLDNFPISHLNTTLTVGKNHHKPVSIITIPRSRERETEDREAE